MSEPKIADTKPKRIQLEKDKKYAFCTCGESASQPFCDGSHKAKGVFSPKIFTVEQDMEKAMCMCKQSELGQFCDGAHKKLKA